ncbi:MAG: GNAT family N-acetyltransferase, partial [Anaerolineales bacterium]
VVALRASLPLSGFVWEEDGQLVGNLTLIPYISLKHNYYLIANVAVHPVYRRRGIARSLTLAAIEHIQRRGVRTVWLHVRGENSAAAELYRSLGFVERASRITWHSAPETTAARIVQPPGFSGQSTDLSVKVMTRHSREWPVQRLWLARLYPPQVAWQLPLRVGALQPGIKGFLYRLFNDIHPRQWSAWREDRLIGAISWQSSLGYTDHVWLALDPDGDQTAAYPLLNYVRRRSSPRRTLALDFPSGVAEQEIRSAGFEEHQTLIWMSKDLNSNA